MIRHGSSHGFAVLVCSLAAALLIDLLKVKVPMLISGLNRVSDKIIAIFDIPVQTNYVSTILFASILAFIWGVFFKIRQNGR